MLCVVMCVFIPGQRGMCPESCRPLKGGGGAIHCGNLWLQQCFAKQMTGVPFHHGLPGE